MVAGSLLDFNWTVAIMVIGVLFIIRYFCLHPTAP
jgi:hypothetical protein